MLEIVRAVENIWKEENDKNPFLIINNEGFLSFCSFFFFSPEAVVLLSYLFLFFFCATPAVSSSGSSFSSVNENNHDQHKSLGWWWRKTICQVHYSLHRIMMDSIRNLSKFKIPVYPKSLNNNAFIFQGL